MTDKPSQNDPDVTKAAAALGVELRLLARVAADFIRLTDEALLVADAADARVALQHLVTLEGGAQRLAMQCDAFREARDWAHRLLGEDA